MKESTKNKIKKYVPCFCIGAGALMLGIAIGKTCSHVSSSVVDAIADTVKPDDSVEVFEGFVSPDLGKTVASLVLDADFDPYTSIGKQLHFSNDIGTSFTMEIIQAG